MQHVNSIQSIMLDFAASTGLSDTSRKPRRYLWTDAFAVCNFLELSRQTGQDSFLVTARKLVDQVHFILGRYSENDSRKGWISGLDEPAGYAHPTVGGLRIGKKLVERKAHEVFDERLEWDRDGQYFHYLTKWMQALARIAACTGEAQYQRWALELASASHEGFTYRRAPGKPLKMYWKMSVDLSRPLVASMGHHDPLDALITYLELKASTARLDGSLSDLNLDREIAECQSMCEGRNWATDDPLGTGGLLFDTLRLEKIRAGLNSSASLDMAALLSDCEAGLMAFQNSGILNYPAEHRLAFREFGLAIGLHALARLGDLAARSTNRFSVTEQRQLASLLRFSDLSDVIENFWLKPTNRRVNSWCEHADINSVMLATSLAPDSYLSVGPHGV